MAVIVQVPDESTSSLARRLLGRRPGVSVVVTDPDATADSLALPASDANRRIVVGSPDSGDRNARNLGLLRQGIWGVVPASSDSINKLLRGYVDDVLAGLCPLLNEITKDHGETQELVNAVRRRPRSRTDRNADNPLSERETEILQRISRGVTSREIAEEMGFQLQTVKNKMTVILTKTHARSRSHAVSIALTRGWIPAP
jgi:DNA-binding NarL/FixJ family response regulator